MIEMTEAIVKAVKLPVTVKTRLGWDDETKNIVDVAERLQDAGIRHLQFMEGPGHSFIRGSLTGP